jgi:hypothetical protein
LHKSKQTGRIPRALVLSQRRLYRDIPFLFVQRKLFNYPLWRIEGKIPPIQIFKHLICFLSGKKNSYPITTAKIAVNRRFQMEHKTNLRTVLILISFAALLFAGCNKHGSNGTPGTDSDDVTLDKTGDVVVNLYEMKGLSLASADHTTVTATRGTETETITIAGAGTTGTLTLAGGTGWVITATTYDGPDDATANVLYSGSASGIGLVDPNGSALIVNITMVDQTTPGSVTETAPTIVSWTASADAVAPNSTITLNVAPNNATDIEWLASCGTVANSDQQAASWTAPGTEQATPCTITITLTSADGLTDSKSMNIDVHYSNEDGDIDVTLAFNDNPSVTDMNATVGRILVSESVTLTATVDNEITDTNVYAWTFSGCTGTFTDAAVNPAVFTLNDAGSGYCAFTVTVTDALSTQAGMGYATINAGPAPAATVGP